MSISASFTYTPEPSRPCSPEMVCQNAAPIWLPFAKSISTRFGSELRVYVHTGQSEGGPVITLLSVCCSCSQCRVCWLRTRAPREGGILGAVWTYNLTHTWTLDGVVLGVGSRGEGVVVAENIKLELVFVNVVVVRKQQADGERCKSGGTKCLFALSLSFTANENLSWQARP